MASAIALPFLSGLPWILVSSSLLLIQINFPDVHHKLAMPSSRILAYPPHQTLNLSISSG
ncbi:hypothetical protein BDR06DRAFT_955809 [Suillus hirtellus]|nr:hypothetical protein BDR06DRAFT_955809 [Suillus hirtellus]